MRVSLFTRAVFVAAALLGCSAQTQLIVSVDTDYDVPAGIDEILFEVTGPSGTTREARQVLEGVDELPHTLTVVPAAEALGPVQIRVTGLRMGVAIVSQDAQVTLQAGQSTTLRMFLHRQCAAVSCDSSETCRCGACVDRDMLADPWSGGVVDGDPCMRSMDAGVADAGDAAPPDGGGDVDDGGLDAGPSCTTDAECDDGLACTQDTCSAGACVATPDDAACTDGMGGVCVGGFGCQYDGCSPSTCVAGPCETARCDGDTCVLEPACAATEECCGGSCVPIGCEDGNPCTDDSCGATGCDHSNNTATCDDGTFCNGADTCSGGTCSASAGDPCMGDSVCDETMDRCVGCATDADCPADIPGAWGSCAYTGGSCDQTGTRQRVITAYRCVSNVCTPSSSTESEPCTRTTTGDTCGTTTFGGWGACGGFSGTCGEAGTRTRTRTDRQCAAGACVDVTSSDSGTCARDTDTNSCGTTTYGGWSSCGGFSDTCDQTGTRTRSQMTFACAAGTCRATTGTDSGSCTRTTNGTSCGTTTYGGWGTCGGFADACAETGGTQSRTQTVFECASGTCGMVVGTDTRSCSRTTNGNSCGTTTYGPWGACGGFADLCDETGTWSRTATVYTCSSGTCGSTDSTDTGPCTRNTDGASCNNRFTCQTGTCSGGSCSLGSGCLPSECCNPGIGTCTPECL